MPPQCPWLAALPGRFKAATLGVAGIDRCYFAGKISAVSDSKGSVDAGGIVGFLFDDEAYIETQSGNAALFAAAEKGTVRNCFAAADITASTSSVSLLCRDTSMQEKTLMLP